MQLSWRTHMWTPVQGITAVRQVAASVVHPLFMTLAALATYFIGLSVDILIGRRWLTGDYRPLFVGLVLALWTVLTRAVKPYANLVRANILEIDLQELLRMVATYARLTSSAQTASAEVNAPEIQDLITDSFADIFRANRLRGLDDLCDQQVTLELEEHRAKVERVAARRVLIRAKDVLRMSAGGAFHKLVTLDRQFDLVIDGPRGWRIDRVELRSEAR